MNNIKTVEVISALPGLEVGDTLTRKDGNSNFELNVETVTEDYSAVRHISISQSLLNKDEFKAIEWFEKRKSNKERIADLEKELDFVGGTLLKTTNKLVEVENDLIKYRSRIAKKLSEFRNEYARVEKGIAAGDYDGELLWAADESLTVHHNMINLLEKIIA